jgi:hypothetical protein
MSDIIKSLSDDALIEQWTELNNKIVALEDERGECEREIDSRGIYVADYNWHWGPLPITAEQGS